MIRKSLLRQAFRFCSKKQDIEQQTQSKFLTDAQKKFEGVPVHLRAYDKQKYEVPLKKIKKNSGYALVQIEPFPRARIMKICYNLLAQIKKGIPEDDIFRIYNEEKFKYVMELTDKQEDVSQLEKLFAIPSIQIFIRNLADQFDVIEAYRKMQPWKLSQKEKAEIDNQFTNLAGQREMPKYPAYRRKQRVKHNII